MLLKFGFILLGIIFCGYIFYMSSVRYLKIRDLPENIISKEERTKYLKVLEKYVLITGICTVLSLLTFLSDVLELRIIIPLIATFVSGYIYMTLSDEIADFDISKKDSLIITDFLKAQADKLKETQKDEKIKKIDSDNMQKQKDDLEKDIENKEDDVKNEKSNENKE